MSELERWETRYSAPGYHFGKEPNAFLKNHAHLLKAGWNALAVADGEGRNGVFLAELGLEVLAVDLSPNALAKSQALARERGVEIKTVQSDLETWSWQVDTFDLVVGIFFQFCAPAARRAMFYNIKRALKPGGLLLLEGYGLGQLHYKSGGPSEPDRLYTRIMLEEAFADFSSIEVREYDAELNEGSRHVGMAALVDLVGRK